MHLLAMCWFLLFSSLCLLSYRLVLLLFILITCSTNGYVCARWSVFTGAFNVAEQRFASLSYFCTERRKEIEGEIHSTTPNFYNVWQRLHNDMMPIDDVASISFVVLCVIRFLMILIRLLSKSPCIECSHALIIRLQTSMQYDHIVVFIQ